MKDLYTEHRYQIYRLYQIVSDTQIISDCVRYTDYIRSYQINRAQVSDRIRYTEFRYQTPLLKNSRVQVKLFNFSAVVGTQLLAAFNRFKSTEIVKNI